MDVKICDICARRIMDEPIICSLPFPQETVITEDLNGRPVAKPMTKLLPLKVDLCEDCAGKIFQAVLAAPEQTVNGERFFDMFEWFRNNKE